VRAALRSGIPAFGVHPARREVLGLRCYPRLRDLPEIPELAFLLVGHLRVEEVFEEAAEAGVRAFILPGLGNEAGAAGPEIAARIAARAEELGAAVLGPNCMGMVVPGGASAWIGTIPESLAPGGVSFVSQSGSIAEALLALGGRIGFRCIVSSGGEAVRDAADFLAFLARDERTRAIGLFLETVRRPRAFEEALALCAEAEKPVACLKVGRSQAAAAIALAHTGAIVGSAGAFSAVLRRYGALEVDDVPELIELLDVLGRRRRPSGTRVAAVSESGGEAALLADQGEQVGLSFPPLPPSVAAKLQGEFPNFVSLGNPLDAWAIAEPERVYPRCLELLAGSGAFDILLAQVDLSQFRGESEKQWCSLIVRALVEAAAARDIFPAVTTVHTADPWPDVAALAREGDVPLLRGPREALRALARAARWRPARPPSPAGGPGIDLRDLLVGQGALEEYASSLVLERYGIRFPPRRRASCPEEAERVARELAGPVVVKLDGPAHKSRLGGVLFAEDPRQARAAAERLGGPVLVAKRVPPGPEILCGVTRDPDWGPIVAVGVGGYAAEALSLVCAAAAPLDEETALALVEQAPGVARLTGAQARKQIALAAVSLGWLAVEHGEVEAAEVNPIVVYGDEAMAVDALVVLRTPKEGGSKP
jgi:acetyltransferase